MTKRTAQILGLAILLLVSLPLAAVAQQNQSQALDMPRVSPRASVSQHLGLTEISIDYHRPAVNERTVWGTLVPYGQVWRTGANENTLVSFSTDVTVEGQALAAGTYGVHTLPGEDEWQFIFSHDTTAWGSFSYDESRDALRVTVKPTEAPYHQERMAISFESPDNESATVSLHWEKLQVGFKVEIDSQAQILASMREQLKGLSQYFWQGWDQAATYCLQNDVNLEEAIQWADRSIGIEERFNNLSTKAQLLEKSGDSDQAKEIMARALGMGNGGQLHNYARSLVGQDRKDEALAIFQRNLEQNPDVWFVELGLARGYSAVGDFDNAVKNMKIAVGRAPDGQKAYVQGLVDQLEGKTDIN